MRRPNWQFGLLIALLSGSSATLALAQENPPTAALGAGLVGRTIADFTLKDYRGKPYSLADDADKKAVIVGFLGTECPLSSLYVPRLEKLAQRFGPQGVAVIGICSNVQDSITELAAYARKHDLTFPLLKDAGNHLADGFGATRTPEVFLLDHERTIRYCGRVDAQFTFGSGVGLASPVAQRDDLAIAVEELLAGRPVSVPATEPKGCLIGRAREAKDNSPVTYTNQIARLIQKRCLECHREGQIAPFAMTSYEEVAGWGDMIAEVVRERRMPPWHANPAFGRFSNENRLSDDEQALIQTWVKNGCPEGDPADLPAPRTFHESWFMARPPDRVVFMTEEPVAVKAEGVEPYRNYAADPGFTEDTWVKLAECMPGNRAVVHHNVVFIKPPGSPDDKFGGDDGTTRGLAFLAGFAPGTRPLVSPPGWAIRIPAGSKLVFQMHYTPIGIPQTDRSSVGLALVDRKDVTHQMITTNVQYHALAIPPGEANYKVEADKPFRFDATLLSMYPHMHMRGKSFRYELLTPGPEPTREVLLDVPQYDFNWQNSYILAEPRAIRAGTVLHCMAVFDNSGENLANPDPTKTVRWGPQTWEEMMIGWHVIALPVAEAEKMRAGRPSEPGAN
jgi:peroxiredoxin